MKATRVSIKIVEASTLIQYEKIREIFLIDECKTPIYMAHTRHMIICPYEAISNINLLLQTFCLLIILDILTFTIANSNL